MKIKIPENVKTILNKLNNSGHEAVLIGGCIRDALLGREPHDYDIATSAQPEETMNCFDGYKLILDGLKHGTVTVVIDHVPYEITTYRIDGKYTDHRRPDSVEFTRDLKKDMSRRDFTINSIAYDGENIIDYFGGITDLNNKVIKCVGDANERFQEDPLRIMRAIRFSTQLNFDIDSQTEIAMISNYQLLSKIATERIQSELTKIMNSGYLKRLNKWKKLVCYILPGVENINEFEKMVVYMDNCNNFSTHVLNVRLFILIDTLIRQGYNIESAINVVKTMRYPNKVIKSINNMLECNRRVINDSESCAGLLLQEFQKCDIESLLEVKEAKIKVDYEASMIKFVRKIYKNVSAVSKVKLAINGKDLPSQIRKEDRGEVINQLLHSVITKQIENDRKSIMDVLKLYSC